ATTTGHLTEATGAYYMARTTTALGEPGDPVNVPKPFVNVQRVNFAMTSCPDGTSHGDCSVYQLDLSALKLDPSPGSGLLNAFQEGQAIVLGKLTSHPTNVDGIEAPMPATILVASKAWKAFTNMPPEGTFYDLQSLDDANRVVQETKLNSTKTEVIY